MLETSPKMYHNYEIIGIGFQPASKVITTKSLVEKYEWERPVNGGPARLLTVADVENKIGIKERRFADEGETTVSLAIASARQALGIEEMTPEQAHSALQRVRLVIVNNSTDNKLRGIAPEITHGLGVLQADTYDVRQVCAAVPYMLKMAISMLESGMYAGDDEPEALISSTDVFSRDIIDLSDYMTGPIFADAAGTMRLKRSETKRFAYFELTSAGELAHLLEIPPGEKYMTMNGGALYEEMTKRVPKAVNQFFENTGMTMKDFDFVALHPGSGKMQQSLKKHLRIPEDKTLSTLKDYGNTSAASTMSVLKKAYEQGMLDEGAKILIFGFGAGAEIGVGGIEWSLPKPNPN